MDIRYSPGPVGASDVQAQILAPTLHEQRWTLDTPPTASMCHVLQLTTGRALLNHNAGTLPARAPDVMWVPAGSANSLELQAGSTGMLVAVSGALLTATLGAQPDPDPLRQVSRHLCLYSASEPALRSELSHSLQAIETECRLDGTASWHYLAAHVTIVLVLLWRMAGRHAGAAPPQGHADPRLQRFRQLVEAQFREHWTMVHYAAALTISADRLHDLCMRHLGRTPIALVHQRVVHEACVMLSTSDRSIERVSNHLGFASASHFSRFFKRWMLMSPKAYRQQVRAQTAGGQPVPPNAPADWP